MMNDKKQKAEIENKILLEIKNVKKLIIELKELTSPIELNQFHLIVPLAE